MMSGEDKSTGAEAKKPKGVSTGDAGTEAEMKQGRSGSPGGDDDINNGPEAESRPIVLENDDGTGVPPILVQKRGAGAGPWLAGMLAAVLGVLGCLLSFAALAAAVRSGFVASGVAEETAEPLVAAVERLDIRIDQTDDLIDRDGVSGSEFSELRARIDGLSDTASSASRSFAAIDDHVLYRWLPIEKTELSQSLASFQEGADEAVDVVVGADSLTPAQAARIGDRINAMQTSVSGTGEITESTIDSLKNWIRLSALGGFFLALWTLWAQVSLMKRGWRAVRGQPV